jgi:hypothetical protein
VAQVLLSNWQLQALLAVRHSLTVDNFAARTHTIVQFTSKTTEQRPDSEPGT